MKNHPIHFIALWRTILTAGAFSVQCWFLPAAWGSEVPKIQTNEYGTTGLERTPPARILTVTQPATNLAGVTTKNNSPKSNVDLVGRIDSLDELDDKYKLVDGDRVSFRIIEDEDDAKELIVTDSGDLEVPYIGLYGAAGKTCKDLARALKKELEKDYYYQATVIVAVTQRAKSQGRVYLVGPVRAPGPQDIPSDEVLTLSKAILRAGGFSDYADLRKVRVTRKPATPGGPDNEFIVNVEEVLKKGNRSADLPLQDGDLIYVPERLIHY